MKFGEIWNHPLVREHVSSKSVLSDTLEYMENAGVVKSEKISYKVKRYTLLIGPPQLISKSLDRILFETASFEEATKRVTSGIESKKISADDASTLVRGMFIQGERERLYTLMNLLPIYRDPILWPFLWGHLILALVAFPIIMQLQILRACEDNYPQETKEALASLDSSLAKILSSQPFQEYHRIVNSLRNPTGCE